MLSGIYNSARNIAEFVILLNSDFDQLWEFDKVNFSSQN